MISTVRENCYPPVLSPDIAQWQNNASYIKPFKANTLILYYQGISGHQPEEYFVLISSVILEREKCDFVTVIAKFFTLSTTTVGALDRT